MSASKDFTLCILGCGNLGLAIVKSLVGSITTDGSTSEEDATSLPIGHLSICVRSQATKERLINQFRQYKKISITSGDNVTAVQNSHVVLLAVDPADITNTLKEPGLAEALSDANKMLISIAAGWTRRELEATLYGSPTETSTAGGRAYVLRALPNIAAQVGQSMTAIEISEPAPPEWCLTLVGSLFSRIGKTIRVPPSLMNATTALCGSTPAFFAVICDALIDAGVAVGVPRPMAHAMIFQSMLGTASMMQDGLHPALLKDQGTSPEGCTIGGLMVMEEGAVRGQMGRALREAVTIARQMGKNPHVNDTRQ